MSGRSIQVSPLPSSAEVEEKDDASSSPLDPVLSLFYPARLACGFPLASTDGHGIRYSRASPIFLAVYGSCVVTLLFSVYGIQVSLTIVQ